MARRRRAHGRTDPVRSMTALQPTLSEPERRARRDTATARVEELLRLLGQDKPSMPFAKRYALMNELERTQTAYYEVLPVLTLGVCPVCGTPTRWAIDTWGLDGLWWAEHHRGVPPGPQSCPHLRVITGAVSLQGKQPRGVRFSYSHPGPEVPYVVPTMLTLPGMVAVVRSMPMANGYLAYPLTYYSPEPPPRALLVPWWGRRIATTSQGPGGFGWGVTTDPWDFELRPYVERGVLRWIDPTVRVEALSERPASEFPFAGLPGARAPQEIRGDQRRLLAPPDGAPVVPFE